MAQARGSSRSSEKEALAAAREKIKYHFHSRVTVVLHQCHHAAALLHAQAWQNRASSEEGCLCGIVLLGAAQMNSTLYHQLMVRLRPPANTLSTIKLCLLPAACQARDDADLLRPDGSCMKNTSLRGALVLGPWAPKV